MFCSVFAYIQFTEMQVVGVAEMPAWNSRSTRTADVEEPYGASDTAT